MATYTPNLNLYKPDPSDPFGEFREKFNENMDKLDNGGGSGDSVSWTQVQQSGTKIAEIDINGVSQNVYAPSGGGGGGLVYSETEQVIGEFCGKPLYQKCIPFSGLTLYANSGYAFDISSYIADYEILFPQWDMTYYFVNNVQRSFTQITVEPPNVILVVPVTRTNISGHIVMRYTKTTD